MMRASRLAWLIPILPIVAIFIYERFVHPSERHWAELRERAAAKVSSRDLEVAVLWPRASSRTGEQSRSTAFVDGARLAAAEINMQGGVLLVDDQGQQYARRIALRFFDEPDENAGVSIARRIARDSDIVAVVGNRFDKSAIPASIVYNNSGVLFIAPSSTDPALTMHNFDFVFRTAPRDLQVATAMVDLVAPLVRKKRVHVALLYPQILASKLDDRQVADLLTEHANMILEGYGDKIDFQVVVARQYERGQQDFDEVIRPLVLGRDRFNVILVADVLPDALNLRLELERQFERVPAEDRGHDPRFLDLTGLDWGRADAHYMDFTPETSDNFFDIIARLVLWETKQNAIVLASRDDLGRRLGAQLNSRIINTWDSPLKRLNLELFRLYDPKPRAYTSVADAQQPPTFAPLVAEVLGTQADYIFVAGGEEASAELTDQLREAGVEQPIICGLELESRRFRPRDAASIDEESLKTLNQWMKAEETAKEAGEAEQRTVNQIVKRLRREAGYAGPASAIRRYVAEWRGKTYVASTFNPKSNSPQVENFVDRYGRTFGGNGDGSELVDSAAAFGYFALHLVRHAFERSGTASPRGAAVALRLYADEDGVLGENRFSAGGDLLGLKFDFKQMDPDGTYHVIPIPARTGLAAEAVLMQDTIPGAK